MLRRLGYPVAALSLLVLLLVAGLAGVSRLKFSSFLSDSINRRLEVVVTNSVRDFSAAIDLGLSLEEIANGPSILDRGRAHDPNILSAYVLDLDGEILHVAGMTPASVDSHTLTSLDLALRGVTDPEWRSESDDTIRTASLIQGSFGQPAGAIVLEYPTTEMRAQTRSMTSQLALYGLVVAVGMSLSGALVFGVFRSRLLGTASASGFVDPEVPTISTDAGWFVERSSRFLALSVSGLLVVGVGVFGVLIVRAFNSELEPELERRAALIGETITDDTERAIQVGIPMEDLVGVEEYFRVFLDEFPELDYLAIVDAEESPLYVATVGDRHENVLVLSDGSTRYGFELREAAAQVGAVIVGVDSGFVRSQLDDLALDILVILIVVLVIAYEATLVLSRRIAASGLAPASRTNPSWRSTGTVSDIRMVLFLFIVGEELSKSFLPLLIESTHNPIPVLGTEIVVSLPFVAYLLTIAVTSLFTGRLDGRIGNKTMFAIGVVPAALSHLGMVFADNVLEIVVLRSLTGVGYALVTVSAMEYILDRISTEGRAKAIGVFVTVVIGGTFSGTALGGILADRLGYDDVFVISFCLVVLAGLLGSGIIKNARASDGAPSDSFRPRDVITVLKHPPIMRLMAGIAVPMNVLMVAFLWYLVPLTMASFGSSASAIARTLMVYYLMILLGGPVAIRLLNRHVEKWILVGIGSVASALALLVPAVSLSGLTIGFAVFVVGVGHAVVRGTQVVLALELADTEFSEEGRGPTMAAMRAVERLGSLAGLLAVAVLASWLGLRAALFVIGLAGTVAGLGYMVAGPFVETREPVHV